MNNSDQLYKDAKKNLLAVMEYAPGSIVFYSKEIGISRPTLTNFLKDSRSISAITIMKIMKYSKNILKKIEV